MLTNLITKKKSRAITHKKSLHQEILMACTARPATDQLAGNLAAGIREVHCCSGKCLYWAGCPSRPESLTWMRFIKT